MKSVKIDCSRIDSWNSFHWVFDEALGFPDYYGMNVNAWIEYLTDLDDPDSGMTSIHVEKGQVLVLELLNVSPFQRDHAELYATIIELSALVNYRRIEAGQEPILALSFYQSAEPPMPAVAEPVRPVADPVRPAPVWKRVVASILDFLTVFFVAGFAIVAAAGGYF